jgi:hypothetical protein
MKLLLSLVALLACSIPALADGYPVIVPSPIPSALAGLSSVVNGIPGSSWSMLGLITLLVGGVLDVIARRWPTSKPMDVARFISAMFSLVSLGFAKLASLIDLIIPPKLKGLEPVVAPVQSAADVHAPSDQSAEKK